jgi:hypothetical protein
MSESAIRTQIYTILNAVTNVGKVYDYERWTADWTTFINLFKTTISGIDQIRGWEIGRRSAKEERQTLGANDRDHTFIIRGYLGLNDAAATEKTMNNLVEAIAAAFRANLTLNGAAVQGHDYLQIDLIEARTFGSVLCHYAELRLNVHDFELC